jgi:hypothetical protein
MRRDLYANLLSRLQRMSFLVVYSVFSTPVSRSYYIVNTPDYMECSLSYNVWKRCACHVRYIGDLWARTRDWAPDGRVTVPALSTHERILFRRRRKWGSLRHRE